MKQNLHLLKVGISQHSYYICQFPAIFRLMWAFAFFSILYPEKNIKLPHGRSTIKLKMDNSGFTKLISC